MSFKPKWGALHRDLEGKNKTANNYQEAIVEQSEGFSEWQMWYFAKSLKMSSYTSPTSGMWANGLIGRDTLKFLNLSQMFFSLNPSIPFESLQSPVLIPFQFEIPKVISFLLTNSWLIQQGIQIILRLITLMFKKWKLILFSPNSQGLI